MAEECSAENEEGKGRIHQPWRGAGLLQQIAMEVGVKDLFSPLCNFIAVIRTTRTHLRVEALVKGKRVPNPCSSSRSPGLKYIDPSSYITTWLAHGSSRSLLLPLGLFCFKLHARISNLFSELPSLRF
jgi:hypothetical protein